MFYVTHILVDGSTRKLPEILVKPKLFLTFSKNSWTSIDINLKYVQRELQNDIHCGE